MSTMEQTQEPAQARPDRHLLFGLALVVLGALMLADQLSLGELENSWPVFPIVFGIWKLIHPPPSGRVMRSRRPGMWLLYIGAWGIVNEFHLFGLSYEKSWPLMIVGVGLMLVWRSFEGPDRDCRPKEG
jgi:Domain of unknown function (DUF5668)